MFDYRMGYVWFVTWESVAKQQTDQLHQLPKPKVEPLKMRICLLTALLVTP